MQPSRLASCFRAAGTAASSPPRWGPVLSIAALHGAVTLAWVVYNLYLVQLLVRAGFDAYLASVLLTVEGIVGAALEPLMGGFSDRARRGVSRRSVLVVAGVLLASVLFVALPLTAAAGPGAARLVPALLFAWACAMALFRAPALSLLSRHARREALPLAASVLTATAGAGCRSDTLGARRASSPSGRCPPSRRPRRRCC